MDKDIPQWLKYTGLIVIPILLLLWGVYTYFNPNNAGDYEKLVAGKTNIADIFYKTGQMGTSLEKSTVREQFVDKDIYGKGAFLDLTGQDGEPFSAYLNVFSVPVSCVFNEETKTKADLQLLKKGQNITFSGVFTNGVLNGGGWYIDDCELLKEHPDFFLWRWFGIAKSKLQGF